MLVLLWSTSFWPPSMVYMQQSHPAPCYLNSEKLFQIQVIDIITLSGIQTRELWVSVYLNLTHGLIQILLFLKQVMCFGHGGVSLSADTARGDDMLLHILCSVVSGRSTMSGILVPICGCIRRRTDTTSVVVYSWGIPHPQICFTCHVREPNTWKVLW